MQSIDLTEYQDICEGATVLEADSFGEKVLVLPDGNFLKLFRLKSLFSSALFYPYAQRFADNVRALQQLGIPCPEALRVVRVKEMKRDAVLYRPLAGNTLRSHYADRKGSGIRDQGSGIRDQGSDVREQE